jgi:hypothetical protein
MLLMRTFENIHNITYFTMSWPPKDVKGFGWGLDFLNKCKNKWILSKQEMGVLLDNFSPTNNIILGLI